MKKKVLLLVLVVSLIASNMLFLTLTMPHTEEIDLIFISTNCGL
ncbi:MAG: hypothetical protein ACOYWZ_09215 [Bacillota bacterium]